MIYEIIEDLLGLVWKATLGIDLFKPFPRMTYKMAIEKVNC